MFYCLYSCTNINFMWKSILIYKPIRICFIVPFCPHLQLSSSPRFHLFRLAGDGNTSYVDLIRNDVLAVSQAHISFQVIFLSTVSDSHCRHCPCTLHCTNFTLRSSSSLSRISLTTAFRFSTVFLAQNGLKLCEPRPLRFV